MAQAETDVQERVLRAFAMPSTILGPRVATICMCGLPFCIHDEQMRRYCRRRLMFDDERAAMSTDGESRSGSREDR